MPSPSRVAKGVKRNVQSRLRESRLLSELEESRRIIGLAEASYDLIGWTDRSHIGRHA